jgi:hypothetical protein
MTNNFMDMWLDLRMSLQNMDQDDLLSPAEVLDLMQEIEEFSA